jgi:hypothetical protein
MSGIFSTQSGFPTTLFSGSTLVPDLAHPGKFLAVSDPLLLGAGTTWLNGDATQVHPSAFANGVDTSAVSQPLVGAQGTSGRNHLRLDGLTDYDAAITKQIRVTEGQDFQIRWEVFNALNHPNLSGFGNTFTLPGQGFGQYSSTATNMRQMQIALRYQF